MLPVIRCGPKPTGGFEPQETSQANVVTAQASNGGTGNIIVLNFGNGNSLTTTLSQLGSVHQAQSLPGSEISPPPIATVPCSGNESALLKKQPQQGFQHQPPAAFMLVPIPQIPPITVPSLVPNASSQQLHQSSLLSNVPNCIAVPPPVNQKASTQNFHYRDRLSTFSTKSDELRTFLTNASGPNVYNAPLQQSAASEISCGSRPILSSCKNHESPPSEQIRPELAENIPNTTGLRSGGLTVSSPALAFLAQVSSFASDQRHSSVAPESVELSNQDAAKAKFTSIPSNETNKHSECSEPSSYVTDIANSNKRSETRKDMQGTGDSGSIAHSDDNEVQKLMQQSDFQKQDTDKKRKKEAPVPPPVREKKKKGPAPKLSGHEVCLICGDRASGFHYNTLSCEGCKGFFRRTVIKGAKYCCKLNGDCTMDLYMRRKCQKCRFEKCKAVGMKEESVLSEEKVKTKKFKKECDSTLTPAVSPVDDSSKLKLTAQQRRLLDLLKENERRFQWPTSEDMKKVTVWVEGDDTPHSRALRFAHFTELCILIVQLVVEFTKQLPGFLSVLREDQIVLLKACAIEVMLLRAAKQYNKRDGTINFLNGKLYDKSSFYKAGMQVEFVDPIFQFCSSMAQLDLDETEYAILVAINTFSTDRPHIKDVEKVECMQDPYVDLLRVYSKMRHPDVSRSWLSSIFSRHPSASARCRLLQTATKMYGMKKKQCITEFVC